MSFDPRGVGSVEARSTASATRTPTRSTRPTRPDRRSAELRGVLRRHREATSTSIRDASTSNGIVARRGREPQRRPRPRPASAPRSARRPAQLPRLLVRHRHRVGVRAAVPRSRGPHGARRAGEPLGDARAGADRRRRPPASSTRSTRSSPTARATEAAPSTRTAIPRAALRALRTGSSTASTLPTRHAGRRRSGAAGSATFYTGVISGALRQAVRLARISPTRCTTPTAHRRRHVAPAARRHATTGAAPNGTYDNLAESSGIILCADRLDPTPIVRPSSSTSTRPASQPTYPFLGGYASDARRSVATRGSRSRPRRR